MRLSFQGLIDGLYIANSAKGFTNCFSVLQTICAFTFNFHHIGIKCKILLMTAAIKIFLSFISLYYFLAMPSYIGLFIEDNLHPLTMGLSKINALAAPLYAYLGVNDWLFTIKNYDLEEIELVYLLGYPLGFTSLLAGNLLIWFGPHFKLMGHWYLQGGLVFLLCVMSPFLAYNSFRSYLLTQNAMFNHSYPTDKYEKEDLNQLTPDGL